MFQDNVGYPYVTAVLTVDGVEYAEKLNQQLIGFPVGAI